jgi:hypothetical protein
MLCNTFFLFFLLKMLNNHDKKVATSFLTYVFRGFRGFFKAHHKWYFQAMPSVHQTLQKD